MMPKSPKSNDTPQKILIGLVMVAIAALALWQFQSRTNSRNNWPKQFTSNGQRIYFTSTSASGEPIDARGTQMQMGIMMGSGCVACHGADRLGKKPFLGFGMSVPPLTADALFGERKDQDHGDHDSYTDETLRRAITTGIDAGGQPLDSVMPRWSMSDKDLADVIAFLKTGGPGSN